MKQVIVIGGGAAGMMAAIQAAEKGNQVLLLEKNEKLGKKIYITGKGRCNITNACETEDLFKNVLRNSKFLYSAFYSFSNWQVMDFFHSHGLAIKTERGERVFPQSDHSSDVIRTLQRVLKQKGVQVRFSAPAAEILEQQGKITGVRLTDGEIIHAEAVIIATGGCSYASTGSAGDGYKFAEMLGHTVMKPQPSLVPFGVMESWVKDLQGLSLRNIKISIRKNKKLLYEEFGEMLFTHYGVSGPLILSASGVVNDYMEDMPLSLTIDLKPALSEEQLDKRVLRDFQENQNRQFKNAVQKLFPAKLIPVMIHQSGIDADKKVNEITKEERQRFVRLIKEFSLTLSEFRGFNEAIITRGGVNVKEINPSTMESKLVNGLYFAGEVLDVDALTGGFNLQIAWSTGFLAGDSILEKILSSENLKVSFYK
ncbi:NAD(P)/FAD-dependent oxidoreductase [Lachnospiraceae bacterium]|nr:NAD(P)/FAD-dependent oxidoreductase [Lachnospiraceae bacterium]